MRTNRRYRPFSFGPSMTYQLLTVMALAPLSLSWGMETGPRSFLDDLPPSPAAAKIDDSIVISQREVDQVVDSIVDQQPISDGLRQQLRQTALQQLIAQRLIVLYLADQNLAASETDIDAYVDQLESRLEKQKVGWSEFLQQLGVSDSEYRSSVKWKLSWDNYLRNQLTEENLKRFFERHQRSYDGTELEVAQILVKLPQSADESQVKEAIKQLEELRRSIDNGSLSFADAAREHSQAASAPEGGGLGRIARQGAMPEAFSAAAFALEPGTISQPVVTNIGVHLIQCQKVIPGDKAFADVQAEVRQGAVRYLFDWLASRQRDKHQVEIMSEVQ